MGKEISSKELAEILKRFQAGTCTPTERMRVLEWLEALDENELINDAAEKEAIEKRLLKAIEAKIDEKPSGQYFIPVKHSLWPLLAAACLLGLLWIFQGTYFTPVLDSKTESSIVEKRIVNTEQIDRQIVLEDGSEVTLRPGAEIVVGNLAQGSQRTIRLTGAAYFDVSHDPGRPFVVFTGAIKTLVLGTRFLIEASQQGDVKVSVTSGKVSVEKTEKTRGDTNEVILVSNQQAFFESQKKRLTATIVQDPKPIGVEVNDNVVMDFDDEPLPEILKALEEIYGITIEFDSTLLSHCRITTSFSHHNLFQRLEILTRAIGATYQVDGTRIIITGTGCN